MKNARNIALSIISSALLAGAAWALLASPAHAGTQGQNAAQLQIASGKITAVSSNSFTLKTASTNPPEPQCGLRGAGSESEKGSEQGNDVFVDQNTTVDGKLQVGANADVSYRTDSSGNNIAITVHVTPQS